MEQNYMSVAELIARVAYMSKYGEAIRERREMVMKDGPELAQESLELEQRDPVAFQRFSQQTFSRWEGDRIGAVISASNPRRLRALAHLLEWSAKEMLDKVGVSPGYVPGFDPEPAQAEPLGRWQVSPNFVVFPVFHSANAGTGEGEPITNAEAAIPLEHLVAKGVSTDEAMVIRVNGDCMVSSDARSTESIKHHDYVAIHIGAPARPGKIGVFWDETSDQLIIKGVGEGTADHVILYPANGGPPVVRPREDPELIYRGLVFWRGGNVN